MPIKRRRNKSAHLPDMKIEDLFYGPGTCLFNGEGYLGAHGDGLWSEKSEAVKEAVLAEMREDWQRHHLRVLAAWEARTDHEKEMGARHHHSTVPWALTEFGEPQ